MTPAVSVLMNCYNSDRFLENAIASVFSQTFGDWEIVFWDNQSTDRSADIARGFGSRLRYFRGETFLPLGAARNEALRRARGRYIALLDCDDRWLPQKLEKQVALMQSDAELGLVFSDASFIDAEGRAFDTFFRKIPPPRGDLFWGLLTGRNFIPCPTALFLREAAQACGGFDADLKYSEELELFLKIGLNRKIGYLPEILAEYRLHGANATGTGNAATTKEALLVLKRMSSRLPSSGLEKRLSLMKRSGVLNAKLAWQTLKQALAR